MEENYKKIKISENDRIDLDDIVMDDNPLLRKISFEIPYPLSKTDKKIMHQMIDFVRSSNIETELKNRKLRPAYGISAIQIGYSKKMLFARVENEFGGAAEEFALVNPKIIEKSKNYSYLRNGEECLSVSAKHQGYVMRHHSVKIVAIDFFTDREVEITAKGLTAIVLQHEMDHLLGILFYDRINKLKPFKIKKDAIKI